MCTNCQFCEWSKLVTKIDFELDYEICMKFPVTIHLKRKEVKDGKDSQPLYENTMLWL